MPLTDAMFLLGETRNVPLHVGSLQLFTPPEGETGGERLRAIQERWLQQREVSVPYGKRPVRNPLSGGQWAWQIEKDLDLEHHLRRSALPSPGRPRELLELVGRLHGTLLDRQRPLWETHLIEGMADGRFAIYSKLHHSVADGVGGMRLTVGALSPDPDQRDMPAPWTPGPVREKAHRSRSEEFSGLLSTTKDLARVPPTVAKVLWQGLRERNAMLPFQAPRSILNTNISSARRFAAQSWSLDRIKTLSKDLGVTVNDIVLAMSAGALRAYLLELDALPDMPLVAMVPVALRTGEAEREGNAVGAVLCNLGTHETDPAARLATIRESMLLSKDALEGLSAVEIQAIGAGIMMPATAAGWVRAHTVARPAYNLIISNVPGGRGDLYYDGARLESIYPLSIPQDGQALNITVISQGSQINVGLVGCRKTLPHLQRLLKHLEAELVALGELV